MNATQGMTLTFLSLLGLLLYTGCANDSDLDVDTAELAEGPPAPIPDGPSAGSIAYSNPPAPDPKGLEGSGDDSEGEDRGAVAGIDPSWLNEQNYYLNRYYEPFNEFNYFLRGCGPIQDHNRVFDYFQNYLQPSHLRAQWGWNDPSLFRSFDTSARCEKKLLRRLEKLGWLYQTGLYAGGGVGLRKWLKKLLKWKSWRDTYQPFDLGGYPFGIYGDPSYSANSFPWCDVSLSKAQAIEKCIRYCRVTDVGDLTRPPRDRCHRNDVDCLRPFRACEFSQVRP